MRTGPETPLACCVDFAIYPLGTSTPYSKFIARVEEILKQLGKPEFVDVVVLSSTLLVPITANDAN